MATKNKLSNAERRKRFFYGEADAALYDADVDLNTPLYGLINRTLLELLENHFGVLGSNRHGGIRGYFLDIGSGTGAQSIAILERFPNLHSVGLDVCEPMHRIFESKAVSALGQRAFKQRCTLITGDLMSSAGSLHNLLKPLAESGNDVKYKAVVTAFALHHLTHREKHSAYKRIFDVLEPGGLLLNADLFAFQSPVLKRSAQEFTIAYINKQHTEPDAEFLAAYHAVGSDRERLRKAWVRHCERFNLPAPIESAEDGIQRQRRRKNVYGQARMLLDVGFVEVGCPLRYWQVGILWGKR